MAGIITTILIILYRIPLIIILGDKAIGYYSIAYEWFMLFTALLCFGLPETLSRQIKNHAEQKDYKSVSKIFQGALLYAFTAGLISSLLFILLPAIFTKVFIASEGSTQLLKLLGINILLTSILSVFHGFFQGMHAFKVSKVAKQVEQAGVAVFSVLLVVLLHETGAVLGITAGIILSLLFLILLFTAYNKKFKKLVKRSRKRCHKTYHSVIRKLIISMFPLVITTVIYHLSNIVDYAIFSRIMRIQGNPEHSYIILLGLLNGKYEFFISLPLLAANFMAVSIIPEIRKIREYNNLRLIHTKISSCLRYTMMIIIPCVFSYIILAKPLMIFFFQDSNITAHRMLQIGAISIIFFGIAAIANAVLCALDRWTEVAKNALLAVVIHGIVLFMMLVVFEWRIYAVVISRIVFSASLCILNEHSLRGAIGYVQEQKRTFTIPLISSVIMAVFSLLIRLFFELFVGEHIAIFFALLTAFIIYFSAMIFLGGISEKEMLKLPLGKKLAPFCRKIHLLK